MLYNIKVIFRHILPKEINAQKQRFKRINYVVKICVLRFYAKSSFQLVGKIRHVFWLEMTRFKKASIY